MEIAQKALYNSLRLNWLEQQVPIEPWKVEDYRALTFEQLFCRLNGREYLYPLDKISFKSYSDQFDSPEELTEWLISVADLNADIAPEENDQIFLVVFELWRRLIPEKPSISIILDELDHAIFCHDTAGNNTDALRNAQALQDAIDQLYEVLQENVDLGIEPEEAFSAIMEYSATDLEDFFYDYIAEEIAQGHVDYAQELIERLYPFILDKRWFQLLKARLMYNQDGPEATGQEATRIVRALFESNKKSSPSLDFDLEILETLVIGADRAFFSEVVSHVLTLLETQGDFMDLLHLVADFFGRLDDEERQTKVELLSTKKKHSQLDVPFSPTDPLVMEFRQLLKV